MDPTPKTIVSLKVSFEIDLEYDPFKGRSLEQLIGLFEDDLLDAVNELRPETQEVYHLHTTVFTDV
jgi:hypothetical protein